MDYGVRLRWYVEGDTEYYALQHYLANSGWIEFINLRGQVIERTRKGMTFRENLQTDKKREIYSFISIDGDKSENARAVRLAPRSEEFYGRFQLSIPDFEFANFAVGELQDLLVEWASESGVSPLDEADLRRATQHCASAKDFFDAAHRASSSFARFDKGASWGAMLMKAVRANPNKANGEARPAVSMLGDASRTFQADFHWNLQRMRTDPATGLIVPREANHSTNGD